MTQDNTRPYFTIDELNAWADEKLRQAWRNAALRLGEELSSVGPKGYYDMTPEQWLDWALEQSPQGKNLLPEKEPVKMVAYICSCGRMMKFESEHGVVAPKREWVAFTDEEINQGLLRSNHAMQMAGAWRDGVEWATKQLKEKNK